MLPFFKDPNETFMLLQTKWASILNPLLGLPLNSSNLIQGQVLAIGTNQVNHKLGRKLKGWIVTRKTAGASLYDAQNSNQTPSTTLALVSDAIVTVDLIVF